MRKIMLRVAGVLVIGTIVCQLAYLTYRVRCMQGAVEDAVELLVQLRTHGILGERVR